MTDSFADSIKESFLRVKTGSRADYRLIQRMISFIRDYLDYSEVSFWSINRNNTLEDGLPGRREEEFISTSLLFRETRSNCNYKFIKEDDYSHPLRRPSLFRKVLQEVDLNKLFERFDKDAALKNGHRSSGFIRAENIEEIIVIPIRESSKRPIAFLELSRTKSQKCLTDEEWEEVAYSFGNSFSSILREYAQIRQQELIDELIKLFNTPALTKDALYNKILAKLQEYCPCQGASIFLCDTYPKRYDYKCAIPGIDDCKNNEKYYMIGEGFTGRCAKKGEIFISDNLSKDQDKKHKIKICEKLPCGNGNSREYAQTGMFIPLHSRINTNDTVGVIRLINKKNICNDKFVDFFNDVDVKIMNRASNYLSPIIDAFVKENKKSKLLAIVSHGLGFYVDNIFSAVYDLKFNIGKTNDATKNAKTKLIDNANGLKMSLENNLFYFNANNNGVLESNVQECSNLNDVISDCKSKVSSLAKNNGFPLNRIMLKGITKTVWICVSKEIIDLVFFNLFNNAIKYKNDDPEQQNEITISVSQSKASGKTKQNINSADNLRNDKTPLWIQVQDNGIGIKKEEKETIFYPGVRGSDIPKTTTGTGMGLYIVRTIVEDCLGGTISVVCCNPTTFKIEIPGKMYYIQ